MRKFIFISAVAFSISSPALADKFFAVTPSGSAETLFPNNPSIAVGELSGKCIDNHWTVVASSANELVCEAPLNFGQSLAGQLLLGNSYSTPPRRFFRFNLADVNGVSRVQASGWMEVQMAFGQVRRTDFAGPEFQNSIMGFMMAAGGKYPQGTTFPNHAYMGVSFEATPAASGLGLKITKIASGTSAEKAGLQVGDIIIGVANKRFKNEQQYLDAMAKAVAYPTYQVEILRAGQSTTLTLDRAFRPPFGELTVAAVERVESHGQLAGNSLDTADEIAKLATLRDKGIITSAEFDARKTKLLGN